MKVYNNYSKIVKKCGIIDFNRNNIFFLSQNFIINNKFQNYKFSQTLNKFKNKRPDVVSMHDKIQRFIKLPNNNSQAFYDDYISQNENDKLRYKMPRQGKLAPTRPIYPDRESKDFYNDYYSRKEHEVLDNNTISNDINNKVYINQSTIMPDELENQKKKEYILNTNLKNKTYNDYFESIDYNNFNRIKQHIKLATDINNMYSSNLYDLSKIKKNISSNKDKKIEHQDIYEDKIKNILDKSNLKNKHKNEVEDMNNFKIDYLEEKIREIVSKLGYLDYREFLALNKYITEDAIHANIIDKVKKSIAVIAIETVSTAKKKELIKVFNLIDKEEKLKNESELKDIDNRNINEYNNESSSSQKKFDYLIDNIKGTSELFYKYYYLLRQKVKEKYYKNMNINEKLEELETIRDKEQKSFEEHRLSEYALENDPILDNEKFATIFKKSYNNSFYEEVDNVVKLYRLKRLTKSKIEIRKVIKLVNQIFKFEDIPELMSQVKEALDRKKQEEKAYSDAKKAEKERILAEMKKEAEERKPEKKTYGKAKVQESSILPPGLTLEKIQRKRSKPRTRMKYYIKRDSIFFRRRLVLLDKKGQANPEDFTEDNIILLDNDLDRRKEDSKDVYYNNTNLDKKKNSNLNEDSSDKLIDYEQMLDQFFSSEAFIKNEKKEEIILFMKYLIINEKLGNNIVYEPTNIEIEKKVYAYLRSRIENKNYLNDSDVLSNIDIYDEYQENKINENSNSFRNLFANDSFFNKLLITSNNLSNSSNINDTDNAVFSYLDAKINLKNNKSNELSPDNILKNILETASQDNESKSKLEFKNTFNRIKNNYIYCKSNMEKQRLLDEFDREYAKQFGFNFAQQILDKKINTNYKDTVKLNNQFFPARLEINTYNDFVIHEQLIRSIVKNYYKEYKLDFMYNYMDYFSNKYEIRNKVSELSANKVSLEEINYLITKLAYDIAEIQAENRRNPDTSNLNIFSNQIKLNISNNDEDILNKNNIEKNYHIKTNKLVNIFDVIMNHQNETLNNNNNNTNNSNKNYNDSDYTNNKTFYNNKNTFKPLLPKQIEDKIKQFPNSFKQEDKDVLFSKLYKVNDENFTYPSKFDNFEVNIYKQLKKDPFYKHHMHTFLSFQTDKHNNFSEFNRFSDKMSKSASNSLLAYVGHLPQSPPISRFMTNYSLEEMQRYYDISQRVREISENSLRTDNNKYNAIDHNNNIPLENEEYDKMINTASNSIGILNKSNKLSDLDLTVIEQHDVFRGLSDFKFTGIGKRKTCMAIASITPGTGKIKINNKPFHLYFTNIIFRQKVMLPLEISGLSAQIDVDLRVHGGGVTGQSEAIIPAISKAIIKLNSKFTDDLFKSMLITHDPRNVERKKFGYQKARKGQVYKRR